MGMKILDNHQRLKLQNTNKNMPRYSKLLDMRDMQMNPAVWYPFIPNSLAAIRKLATACVARETETQGHPCPAGGRVAGAATLERNLALFSQTKYRKTLWPDVPPPAPPSTCLGRCWHGSTCDKGHVRGFSLSVCVGPGVGGFLGTWGENVAPEHDAVAENNGVIVHLATWASVQNTIICKIKKCHKQKETHNRMPLVYV